MGLETGGAGGGAFLEQELWMLWGWRREVLMLFLDLIIPMLLKSAIRRGKLCHHLLFSIQRVPWCWVISERLKWSTSEFACRKDYVFILCWLNQIENCINYLFSKDVNNLVSIQWSLFTLLNLLCFIKNDFGLTEIFFWKYMSNALQLIIITWPFCIMT